MNFSAVTIFLARVVVGHTQRFKNARSKVKVHALRLYSVPRVHKNKSRQLHTMGSVTAEFEVRHR